MKSSIVLMACLAMAVAMGGALADNPAQPLGAYHSPDLGYTLNFPSGWYTNPPIEVSSVTLPPYESFCDKPSFADDPVVCIEVQILPAGRTC